MNELYIETHLEFVKPEIAQLTWHISPRRPSYRVLTLYYLPNSGWNSLVRLKPTIIQIERVTVQIFYLERFYVYYNME